jgi:hypothetical protein
MWARADLRGRWRTWVVLGLLAGATFGLAAAGAAGARRAANALPHYLSVAGRADAAVLANDPTFDATKRRAVAQLPEVRETSPFMVSFLEVLRPKGAQVYLVPTTPATARFMSGVILRGRYADPGRADEVVIDENAAQRYRLDLGSTVVIAQQGSPENLASLPPGLAPAGVDVAGLKLRVPAKVVGITKAVGPESNLVMGSGFYTKYGPRLIGVTNEFVTLRGGEQRFAEFQADVQRIVGHPVNVERGSDLFGYEKVASIARVERNGLLLFALAVVVGGSVMVGQALVRAVLAGAKDVPTWRAIGADRRTLVGAMVLPTVIVVAVGVVTSVLVGVVLSPRFPIGDPRQYDLGLGFHADWLVLGAAAFGLAVAVLSAAVVAAWWRADEHGVGTPRTSTAGTWVAKAGLSSVFEVGARLAVEPGRGHRAVPVRTALVGAIAGVLGVVACFTFRAGITDALTSPQRSGVVWDYAAESGGGPLGHDTRAAIAGAPAVGAAQSAQWARAVPIDGVPTPTFGTASIKGALPWVILSGRAPRGDHELALAPVTARALHATVGDTVTVGKVPSRRMKVVGTALLPASSHTDYDQSAWMTRSALHTALASDAGSDVASVDEYVLLRWRDGASRAAVAAAEQQIRAQVDPGGAAGPPELPSAVVELGRLRVLPTALAAFFALLAVATVAHALVTTVHRRRHDLAVMRSFGFTSRQSRLAIAWQATLLAVAGVVVGVPLGIVVGRRVWLWLADNFPIAYAPPLALVVIVLLVPVAILVANALAAWPGRAAARIRPAEALRVE